MFVKSKWEDNTMIFVCSDIHGNYEVYKKAVDKLSVNDTLYILGDVIDRGPDGITIIQDMTLRDNVLIKLQKTCF